MKRDKFKVEGRDKSSKALQKEYREKALQTKIKELRKTENLTQSEAEKRAKEWISGKAALHDPDQIAGGYADRITGMRDTRVNSSIGSQWRSRIGSVDEAVDNYIKANNIPKSDWGNIYLNVKLVY